MSWSLIGLATITNNGATNPTVASIPGQAGDLMVICERYSNVSQTIPTPTTGGVSWQGPPAQPAIYHRYFARYQLASEAAPSLGTLNFLWVSLSVWRWIGGTAPAVANVFDTAFPATSNQSSTNLPYPASAAAPANANSTCIVFAAASATSTSITDDTVHYTSHVDSIAGSASHQCTIVVDYVNQGAAASIGSGSAAVTGMASGSVMGAVFALTPGTTAASPTRALLGVGT